MARYFTMEEMTRSGVAGKYGIDNTPQNDGIRENLVRLMDFLDYIREYINNPIKVNSGYRCPEVNEKVGGVATSAHCKGYAADIVPGGDMSFEDFRYKVLEAIEDKEYDQCIIERNQKSRWIHISIDPRNRHQTFRLVKKQ